jgi:hypothetical protein
MASEPYIKIHHDEDGNVYYYSDHRLHREDGPAIIFTTGTEHWYYNGKLHRDGAPAIVYKDNKNHWIWYKHGKRHREDGPAISIDDHTKCWFKDGVLHREDGPAIVYDDVDVRYFLNGIQYSFEDWLNRTPLSESEKLLLIISSD